MVEKKADRSTNQEYRRYYDRFHAFAHYCIIFLLLYPIYHLLFRVQISGRQNIPNSTFLIVSNHYSYNDPLFISMATHKPVAYIAKKELFDDLPLGKAITFLGAIPINREKPSHTTLKRIKEVIQFGWPISLFIEGTRNKSQEFLGEAQPGAAFIAKFGGGLSVLPIGIKGGNKIFGQLQINIGQLIHFDRESSLEELTQKYAKAVAELADLRLRG